MSRVASVFVAFISVFVFAIPSSAQPSPAQKADAQGIFLGYQGEWQHAIAPRLFVQDLLRRLF